jgi:Ca2+-binding RTX toxin-like protein
VGVDIGYTTGSTMIWAVFAPTSDVGKDALEGDYAGATAGATVGVGGSVNVLIGGFDIFGATNATLEGGAGADLLVGGQLNDTFVYESGFGPSDLIYLFTPGTDKIQLQANINGTGIATANDALAHASATTLNGIGPVVAVTLGAEIIYVVGLQTLQASDFVIG